MIKEQKYEFRKRITTVHKPGIRSTAKKCPDNFLELHDGLTIHFNKKDGEVIKTAAYDFADFLDASMDISAALSSKGTAVRGGDIGISLAGEAEVDLGAAAGYRGFMIKCSDKIEIFAYDDRGAAQALYYLEDMMTFEGAPFVKRGEVSHKAMFSPQMVHSGYGFDEFPDEYLSVIAHEGRDAILVYTMEANLTPSGYLNFNDLIERAARYGIDVYAYSYIRSKVNPADEQAEGYYDSTYGKLFKECPRLKGVTLVGEAVEFPSNDPHVSGGRYFERSHAGVLHGKPSTGKYPCADYPEWLNLLKKVIRKHNADADIVLWSYNWGSQPEEARVKVIEGLPEDVAMLVTFERFEPLRFGKAISHCADYTLAFAGPSQVFASEARAAKKRGLRLYSMTNTGGQTWDFGTIPYEPMPLQWMKRYEAMRAAKDDWGLCGIMESHHYGFYPSFISKLSKLAFMEPRISLDKALEKILKSEFGEANYIKVDEALGRWSEAITYYTPSNADQYGAFRVGPSFPFYLDRAVKLPADSEAGVRNPMFGPGICNPEQGWGADSRDSVTSVRVPEELKSLEKMLLIMKEGVAALKKAPQKNEALDRLINLGEFMVRTIITGINAKKWYILKTKFRSETSGEVLFGRIDEMEGLLREEIENARETIALVEADSRLGWEPRMLYATDKEHLEWKISQAEGVIAHEIGEYRRSLRL